MISGLELVKASWCPANSNRLSDGFFCSTLIILVNVLYSTYEYMLGEVPTRQKRCGATAIVCGRSSTSSAPILHIAPHDFRSPTPDSMKGNDASLHTHRPIIDFPAFVPHGRVHQAWSLNKPGYHDIFPPINFPSHCLTARGCMPWVCLTGVTKATNRAIIVHDRSTLIERESPVHASEHELSPDGLSWWASGQLTLPPHVPPRYPTR